jgi:hypothetical protein
VRGGVYVLVGVNGVFVAAGYKDDMCVVDGVKVVDGVVKVVDGVEVVCVVDGVNGVCVGDAG